MPGGSGSSSRTGVRVVVVGDRGTGKSSLIAAAATESVPEKVPPVHAPTRLPPDFYPDRVPVTIIDTSSGLENKGKLNEELKRADAVVLTYACNQQSTLSRLSSYWLPELRRLEIKVPIIVAGCKLDLRGDHNATSLEEVMGPIMQQFREIETCVECSATTMIQVPDVFYYAQKAVLHPTAPLFDHDEQTLKPRCVRALKRIFILCDHDMDGALNDAELNEFQVKCFNAPLQPAEIVGVKRVVQEKQHDGVNDLGLTLSGFLFLHALFIEKGRLETTWAVLRKFGYGDDLELRDDFLPVPTKLSPDQSVELASEAVEFLRGIFGLYDIDNDGAVRPAELEDLFLTAPESPWDEAPYKDAAATTALGNLTLKGFVAKWALMTLLDPRRSLANLIYVGYGGDPAASLRVTRKRSVDRKKQHTERNVFRCLLFGPKNAGKSALLNSFLERSFSENYTPTTGEQYAVNVVDQPGGNKKTLILQEIPEEGVKKILSNKEALASYDVTIFVYDRWPEMRYFAMFSSDEYSWKRTKELLVEVARLGEDSGYGVPCLLIASKDDLKPYTTAVQDSARVTQELGIEPPIPVSMKSKDLNHVFSRIIWAAEHPHLNIPETETGRNRKRYRHLVNSSLVFVSVGAAVAVVGLAAFRAYAARRNTSS